MHILDLPQDTFLEILDILYEKPWRYSYIRIPDPSEQPSLPQKNYWQKGNNKTIYNLSLVCKALADYTSPFRRRLRQQLISTRKGMLQKLSHDQPLRQSARYLTVPYNNLPFPSSSPLPNLFALDIARDCIESKLLTWIGSCLNLRHLTLRAITTGNEMVHALADLQLWSLHIYLDGNCLDNFLPIRTLFLGQSRCSLQELIINVHTVPLSTLLPPGTSLPRLKSLYFQVNIGYDPDGFANLSRSTPNLETLVADLRRVHASTFTASGFWPKLKRAYIKYPNSLDPEDALLMNAPSLSECVLQGAYSLLCTFHRRLSPCDLSNIRVLALDFRRDYGRLPSIETLQDLAHILVNLEVFILTLNVISVYGYRRAWDKVEFVNADAASILAAMKGFRSLRVLEWGVGIPSFGDAVDFLSPAWIKRHTPLYKNLIVSIANACPRITDVKWAMSGQKRWVAENFVREDDGSVSTIDFRLSEYDFLDRYAHDFSVFTTHP